MLASYLGQQLVGCIGRCEAIDHRYTVVANDKAAVGRGHTLRAGLSIAAHNIRADLFQRERGNGCALRLSDGRHPEQSARCHNSEESACGTAAAPLRAQTPIWAKKPEGLKNVTLWKTIANYQGTEPSSGVT